MNFLQLCDSACNKLGLGQNLINHVPRHFRWTSLLAFSALVIGSIVLILSLSGICRSYIIGNSLFLIALVLGAFLQVFGPLRRATSGAPLDERERAMRTKAFNISGTTVAVAAIIGAWSMPTLTLVCQSVVTNPSFWVVVALFLSGMFSIIPSLYTSWATEPLASEDKV